MGMGDEAAVDGGDDVLIHNGVFSDSESIESSDTKDDTISIISNANSASKSTRSKKRVQFLPDGFLVRIREIPPRSNKSSSESDGTASDSDTDGSDTESATDSEDVSSERDTPSPGPTESHNKYTTMPPLMYAAKGSYNISKTNSAKTGSTTVAKITGINPSTLPSSTKGKIQPKRSRRSPSPKPEKRTKKNTKCDKTSVRKVNSKNENTKNTKKRTPLKIKEGRISPPPFTKQSKTAPNPKPVAPIKLAQRRGHSANEMRPLPVKKAPRSTVTTSLTVLSASSSGSPESTLDRVNRAMQSLSMDKLYTVDGFIFPQHHARNIHLPDLAASSNLDDFDQPVMPLLTQKRLSVDLMSPRRSLPEGSHLQQTPPQSANRKRRHYAWHMANGSIQNALSTTPSISQLWDSPGGRPLSDSTDKVVSNSR